MLPGKSRRRTRRRQLAQRPSLFQSRSRVAQRTSDLGEARAFAGVLEFLDQQVDLAQERCLVQRQALCAQGPRQLSQAPLVRTTSPWTNSAIAQRRKVGQIKVAARMQRLRREILEGEKKVAG